MCRELLVVSHAPSSPSQPSVAVLYKIVVGWLFEPMSILELQNFLGSCFDRFCVSVLQCCLIIT